MPLWLLSSRTNSWFNIWSNRITPVYTFVTFSTSRLDFSSGFDAFTAKTITMVSFAMIWNRLMRNSSSLSPMKSGNDPLYAWILESSNLRRIVWWSLMSIFLLRQNMRNFSPGPLCVFVTWNHRCLYTIVRNAQMISTRWKWCIWKWCVWVTYPCVKKAKIYPNSKFLDSSFPCNLSISPSTAAMISLPILLVANRPLRNKLALAWCMFRVCLYVYHLIPLPRIQLMINTNALIIKFSLLLDKIRLITSQS